MHKKKWVRMLTVLLPLSLCCALMLNLAASGNTQAAIPPADLPYDISGNVEGSPVVERGYTTFLAENNYLLEDNPNRGLRGFITFTDFPNLTKESIEAQFYEAVNERFDRMKVPCTTYVVYLYMGEYVLGDKWESGVVNVADLDQDFFDKVDYILDLFRQNNIQVFLRFAYWNIHYWHTRFPSTDEMLKHIQQIGDNGVVERNQDVILALQAGFIGQYGEWHSDSPKADRSQVVNAIIEQILPEGMSLQLRSPGYRSFISTENAGKVTLSYNDDCFFGIQDTTNLGNQDYSVGLEPWEYQKNTGYNAPNDAELYVSYWFWSNDLYPDGYACILGAAEHHLTTLSAENGYVDSGETGTNQFLINDNAMNRWKQQPVTEKWLQTYGLTYAPNWFTNKDGQTVERSVFDYMKDYLGYHLSATHLSVTEPESGTLSVELSLQNYGLSAAFDMTSRLVILDAQGNEVSSAPAGDPSVWYATNPEDYDDREQLTHTVTAELTKPTQAGEYRIALDLRSQVGAAARLDNNIDYDNGYNILHNFTI